MPMVILILVSLWARHDVRAGDYRRSGWIADLA